jgi:small conductance mechanosensitive channel
MNTPELAIALRLIIILLLALLARWGVRLLVGAAARRLDKTVPDLERRRRLKTFLSAGRSLGYVLIVIIVALMVLHALGIDIAPLLAGAGLVGLAFSLGAQTLIRDYLGGILILAENQFTVGDVIKVGELSGEVERITLRSTHLRDVEGKLHILSNGDIRTVSNLTANWSRAVVDLSVDYTADMKEVMQSLEAAAKRVQADEALRAVLLEPPQAQGWLDLKDWAVQVRLMAKTAPGQQWKVMTAMRQYALEALQAKGISVGRPAPTVQNERQVTEVKSG